MATKIGDLFFDVFANTTSATKSIAGLGSQFVQVGATAARAIGETVAQATALAVTGMAALTAATLTAGVAYNTIGQSATAAFSTIFDSAMAAADILRDISELALTTPFEGAALTRASRILAGFGVAEGHVVSLTESLIQATAAMGLGNAELGRMAIAFGQIQSRGRLAGDEARQLANYGIDAFGLLADRIGLSVVEVRKLGEEGRLSADFVIPALIEAIEERFGGATEALFQTAAGQLSGLRSTIQSIGSALVQPFIGFARGGAVVDAIESVRLALVDMVVIAEDGSFRLTGALEPLVGVMDSLAGFTANVAQAFAEWITELDGSEISGVIDLLQGLGPVAAAVGAGLGTSLAQAIPIVGRLFAGFNPIVVGITTLIALSPDLRNAFVGAFDRIWDAIQPLIPAVRDFIETLAGSGIIEATLEVIVVAFEGLTPLILDVVESTDELLIAFGPTLVTALEAVAAVLTVIGDVLEVVGGEVVVVGAGIVYLTTLFPALTASIIIATTNVTASGTAAAIAASSFGVLATAIGIALAALGSFRAVSAGLAGDIDYLNEEVSIFERPFQQAGRVGFALGGGDRGLAEQVANFEAAEEAAMSFDTALLAGVETFAEAREAALRHGEILGVSADNIDHFANLVALAWDKETKANFLARVEAERFAQGTGLAAGGADDLTESLDDLNFEAEETVDILSLLSAAANRAWEQVERLAGAGQGATVDDFLRSLPDLARQLTDALSADEGILRDLDVGGVLGDVRAQAGEIVQALAEEYGVGLDGVRELLDERGLAAVIDALGTVTEETTETVDPLIAKYSELGATAGQLRDAISRLDDQRQTRIRAEIDQVEAALRDAKESAERAREAVADFLSGGYLDSPQAAVDDLIGDIGNIGSAIEDALQLGGVRGEAAIRSALGGLQSQLATIVNAGIEAGLSGQQIVDLIGPVAQAIDEEVGAAGRRIATLDWTEGISGEAGGNLLEALQRGMDPAAIQGLISGILGADANVAGLESQLEGLQSSLDAEVEFSPEQVQSALNDIQTETQVEAVITPEAAQLVFDEIQSVFDDEDLETAVNQALITQQILDAAQAAEDQVSLTFKSSLSFDSEELREIARLVGDEFFTEFNRNLRELQDERAREAGFDDFASLQAALGPAVAGAIVSDPTGQTGSSLTINNDITIEDSEDPRATASEVIAASSAATATGGRYDPSKFVHGR